MGLDYDKIKNQEETATNKMASYSDLFTVLSFVFLLLYVVASLRSGTSAIQKNSDYQKLKEETEYLKEKLHVYDMLKEDYIEKSASEKEMEVYQELMSKLDLLKDDAKEEKEKLKLASLENESKENALNKYQQVIRNIINANLIAKERIQRRENVIVEKKEIIDIQEENIEQKEQVIVSQEKNILEKKLLLEEKENVISKNQKIIEEKSQEVAELQDNVAKKKAAIEENEKKITQINEDLENQIQSLQLARKNQQITKEKMLAEIEQLKVENDKKIEKLTNKTRTYEEQLVAVNDQLQQASNKLDDTAKQLEEQRSLKAQLDQELSNAKEEQNSLRAAHNAEMALQREAFEKDLAKQKLTAKEKADKLALFEKKAKDQEEELNKQLASLNSQVTNLTGEVEDTRKALDAAKTKIIAERAAFANQMEKEKKEFLRRLEKETLTAEARAQKLKEFQEEMVKKEEVLNTKIAGISQERDQLSGDLKKAKKMLDAQKKLAAKIKDNFNKEGIDAEVDLKTGDVVLSFGKDYFETGESKLKPSMKRTLEKFIPTYAKSLFSDAKIAEQIQGVEIIGFASPIYQGRYIDPNSLDPKDKKAMEKNLDLSFNRATAIFKYIFDTNKMNYPYQKTLLPLVKVTGKGFLAEGVKGRNIASGTSQQEYCQQYDCKKSQKVIIKFNLKND